jgi:uncharacterized YigZ family protein
MKDNPPFELILSKSKFIGQCFDIAHKHDIELIVHDLKKIHPKASHFCYGYIVDETHQGFHDDGEPKHTAGKPILDSLLKTHLTHTLCVVIRYYGGIMLGASGLTKAYRDIAYETLARTTFERLTLYDLYDLEFTYETYQKMKQAIEALGKVSNERFFETVTCSLQTTYGLKTLQTLLYGYLKMTWIQALYG